MSQGGVGSWLQEALGVADPSPQHLQGAKSDHLVWDEAVEQSTALQALQQHGKQWPAWPGLMQDTFQTYFKPAPALRPVEQVDDVHQPTRSYVEELLDDPATAQTRTGTVLDELASAVGALATGRVLAEKIAANPDLQDSMQKNQPPPPPSQGALHKAIHQAARQGAQEAEDAQGLLMSWGMDPGEMQRVPLGQRLDLALQLAQPKFRRLAAAIGRMRNLARARQGGSLRHLRDELHSVTQGDDLGRVLPAELANLRSPMRRLDFGRRLLEHQLLQYEVRPVPRFQMGPIVALLDASGSMSGEPLEWAAAVGLAFADTARRQKRDFAACYFDTRVLQEFRFPKGKLTPQEILGFATQGAGGGTSYDAALGWGLGVLQEQTFRTADLVLITDGECDVDAGTLAALAHLRRTQGLRVFSILIGGTPQTLTTFSDRVWAVGAPDDEAAGDVFAEMIPVL